MKKLLILTNVLWLSVFVFMGFSPSQNQLPVKKGSAVLLDKTKTAAISIPTEKNNCNTICSNYSNVSVLDGRISAIYAKSLADNYRDNHYPHTREILPLDARSIWFSLETLKAFLWQIESKTATCEGGCPTLNLGVRIYYAEYPPVNDGKFSFGHEKHHTVFMVPTYSKMGRDGRYKDYDFDPNHISITKSGRTIGSNCRPITLGELKNLNTPNLMVENLILMPQKNMLVKNGTAGSPASGASSTGYSSVQNHGTLCPPACNGNEDYFAY